MTSLAPAARFLMCRPEHFAVTYSINPWMDPKSWARHDRVHAAASQREWAGLHRTLLDLGAAIELIPPVAGLPDLVFTANTAVVLNRKALLARFRHPERQREESHIMTAFRMLQARGLLDEVRTLPNGVVLEGAGDCVWDEARQLFWMGYGPRSDLACRHTVEDMFGFDVVAMELADARFYHIDTALCPLPQGEVMYLPCAFTPAGRTAIREQLASHQRIEVGLEDGGRLAANAVCLGNTLLMSGCGEYLRADLTERGYRVITLPLSAFRRSGGAAFCLTLRLDRRSTRHGTARHPAAA
jgi:N-dimethylarginine dimethylaminohydrolase